MCDKINAVAKKELGIYFTSPVALIFLGVFLLISMFTFFWVEGFFARNVVDIRPLFDWMPLLLIFLVSALTMRSWSEERRSGTIELLLTTPVKPLHLVLGKFIACLTLVCIALALTVVIPIAVSNMGNLDWGPVIGGYIAAVLLASAYISIGLFVSSRTDNQVVSLIISIAICYGLYLFGSATIAPLLGNRLSEVFRLIGSGSRFDSVGRGVIDFRDLYYYLSLVAVFLTLNVLSLETGRWTKHAKTSRHFEVKLFACLLILNFITANFWLNSVTWARIDMTDGNIYTISPATESVLKQVREPLLIRGYFSEKTHPLLAPLVPQIRDMLKEYQIAGKGKVRSEFIDPRDNPDLEGEASEKYAIKPVPFRIDGKNETSLVNTYFHVLIKYGDKNEVLSFGDLIEVKPGSRGEDLDVKLKNLEYDLTRSIKKVLYGFQGTDALFAAMNHPVEFVGYISNKNILPEKLAKFSDEIRTIADEFKNQSDGKFNVSFVEPEADNGKVAREINEIYQFKPMISSLFDPQPYYFYMVVRDADKAVQVPLPGDLSPEMAKKTIEAALKRFGKGFLKTIGIYTPPLPAPQQNPYLHRFMQSQGRHFSALSAKLSQNYSLESLDLKKGIVPENVDIMLLVAPEQFNEKELFALDQFLMRGGTVILATSPYVVDAPSEMNPSSGFTVKDKVSGLEAWLENNGISIPKKFVLDPQCDRFIVAVQNQNQRIRGVNYELKEYPYFVSVRGAGLNEDSQILGGLSQISMGWSSPIVVDSVKNADRKTTNILMSSPESWLSSSKNIMPDYDISPRFGVVPEGLRGKYVLGVAVKGVFDSYFKDKESPLVVKEQKSDAEGEESKEVDDQVFSGQIDRSAESAQIVVYSSAEFLTDETLQIFASINGNAYIYALQLVENTVDWALEDPVLLSIRARERFARTLLPMSNTTKMFWEFVFCYGGSLVGLLIVFLLYKWRRSLRASKWARYA